MKKSNATPWREVMTLREDVKTGELTLSAFAADLYDVVMGKARPVYNDPAQFFATTYATKNLRGLVKEVAQRLAGRSDKAIRQLEQVYGGGKTHALITLYHLLHDPEHLPSSDTVAEFRNELGFEMPKARIAVLPFDKIDAAGGLLTSAPDGETRTLVAPWSILAFQLAGADGLRIVNGRGEDAERDVADGPPAETLMTPLLAHSGLPTLILIDEVLMYAHGRIAGDPRWRVWLLNFFQSLTQAAAKAGRCAIVASLLANDPSLNDEAGRQITSQLAAVFGRESEEGIQTVTKEDIAQVLRRQFFTEKSWGSQYKNYVIAAMTNLKTLDSQIEKQGTAADKRYLDSYPFHPDLTEVLYQKWAGVEGLQRTRGVLRTFASALRDAVAWDDSPLVSTNVLLAAPTQNGLSDAAQGLAGAANQPDQQETPTGWSTILDGELGKAKIIQTEPGSRLEGRELEQAVLAVFLHSQPNTEAKANLRDIFVLVGASGPDKIELTRALRRWAEQSWFLDESVLSDSTPALPSGSGAERPLPETWRLGFKPNLTRMHAAKSDGISGDAISAALKTAIDNEKSLFSGVPTSVKSSKMPINPGQPDDNGEFQFVVLGPKAASDPGPPSAEAVRYLKEKAGGAPRVYKNAIVLAVPSTGGIQTARDKIRAMLAWHEVSDDFKTKKLKLEYAQQGILQDKLRTSPTEVQQAVRQAYSIAVAFTSDSENDPVGITLKGTSSSLFTALKEQTRLNIQETPVDAEALLPGGSYGVWSEGENARSVKFILDAFAQQPRLPKMLSRDAILNTLAQGCQNGLFALRWVIPDGSIETCWRDTPPATILSRWDKLPAFEAVLPGDVELSDIPSRLLLPGTLPGLWPPSAPEELSVAALHTYFAGGKIIKIPHEGYEETAYIPKASLAIINTAIAEAVLEGKLWLLGETASFFEESLPAGIIADKARLRRPPLDLDVNRLAPDALPDAWQNGEATALSVWEAISAQEGVLLPWPTVRAAIEGAIRARQLELTPSSKPWPCGMSEAVHVRLQGVERGTGSGQPPPTPGGSYQTTALLNVKQLQDLADTIAEISTAAAGFGLTFRLTVLIGEDTAPTDEALQRLNTLLGDVSQDLHLE